MGQAVTPFSWKYEGDPFLYTREICAAPQKQPLNYTRKRVVTATQPILRFTSRQVLLYF